MLGPPETLLGDSFHHRRTPKLAHGFRARIEHDATVGESERHIPKESLGTPKTRPKDVVERVERIARPRKREHASVPHTESIEVALGLRGLRLTPPIGPERLARRTSFKRPGSLAQN